VITAPAVAGLLLALAVARLGRANAPKVSPAVNSKIELTPEEQLVHRQLTLAQRVPHMLLIFAPLLSTLLLPHSTVRPYLHTGVVFGAVLLSGAFALLYRRRIDQLTPKAYSDSLTWRLRNLNAGIDTRHIEVFVEGGGIAGQVYRVESRGTRITVTQKASSEMTEAELDYAILRTLLKKSNSTRALPLIGIALAPPVVFFAHLWGGASHVVTLVSIGSLMPTVSALLILYAVKVAPKSRATQAAAIDERALTVLPDITSARSAALKLTENVSVQRLGAPSSDAVAAQAARSQWLAAIDTAGRKLGLTSNDEPWRDIE